MTALDLEFRVRTGDDRELWISNRSSIIAGFPDEETSSASALLQNPMPECMKRCDIALYDAKRLGRGKFCHYSDDIDHRVRNRTLLQQSLHLAIANNELELTETTLIDCSPEMLARMNALRGMGFTLAIDDFGAGYSSLKYLSKLPVDKLKIDQWFVGQMLNDSSDAAIIRTIVALGKGLNLEVTAEGVETMPQRDFLLAEGCHAGQGYLFSKPLAQLDFENTIKTRK